VIPWVEAHEPLPPADRALAEPNGLLAAGLDLSPQRLLEAYGSGVFPWFSEGQPVLWWSPDPRMVLPTQSLRVSHSLAKTLRSLARSGRWELRMDTAFVKVMEECAQPRPGQDGTWISDWIIEAYSALHAQGYAHSIEVWEAERLVGGLYGVAIGQMFYGESMFARATDASKVALVHWVVRLRELGFKLIDCQQNTRHLASMGAREIDRSQFLSWLSIACNRPGPDWSTVAASLSIQTPVWAHSAIHDQA
jgi:leucyl/phenylalanyl-tRNA--protein transferase